MGSVFLATILQLLVICSTQAQELSKIVTGQDVSPVITLADSSMFYDLSAFDYNYGMNPLREYTIQGRPGHQVYIYFYTKLANNAIVDIRDGGSNGKQYNLSNIDSQLTQDSYQAPFVKSTTGSFWIRITQFNQTSTSTEDFQALATDYENPAGCDYLVWACQKQLTSTNYNFTGATVQGASCLNIIHATDISNNASKVVNIETLQGDDVKLYKGISFQNNSAMSTAPGTLYAYDKYIILQHSSSLKLRTSWFIGDNGLQLYLRSPYQQMLMSPDYLPYDMTQFMNKPLVATFLVTPPTNSPLGAVILINQLRGRGTLTISLFSTSSLSFTNLVSYNATRTPITYEYRQPFDMMYINYINYNVTASDDIGTNQSGLYGFVQPVDLPNGGSRFAVTTSMMLLILNKLL